MKKIYFAITLFTILNVYSISADDLADILQDLAVQTACLGMYSTAQTGVLVTSRYDDPFDWYDPPMMANRFAHMSGNMTRITTFYGVCFDYAQFAWDDIKEYQKIYNDAGMKDQQWYIAATNTNDPNTIILYDPVSKEKATTVSNGIYLKENSRRKVYAHDGATGHAWLWVQHKNGTWYWIDPTWTDNTGYVWWGIVENGKEVQRYPDPDYCIANNYPRPAPPKAPPPPPQVPPPPPPPPPPPSTPYIGHIGRFIIGYNYADGLPWGFTFGLYFLYFSINMDTIIDSPDGSTAEWIVGASIPLADFLLMPIGIGASHTFNKEQLSDGSWIDATPEHKFVMEIGLQPVISGILYFSATYRLIGFKKSSFTLGIGVTTYTW